LFGVGKGKGKKRNPRKFLRFGWGGGGKRLRGGPRNRLQDEVTEDGRIVGEKGWQKRVCNRE